MKALPNLNDEAAMLLRGKRSALGSARNDATESLRDAYNAAQSADWPELHKMATHCRDCADRLITLAAMWAEVE